MDEAWAAQQELARTSPAVQRDLVRVQCGHMTLTDAPIIGGRFQIVETTTVFIHSELARQYEMHPRDLVLVLEGAIGEYTDRVQAGFFNLFNPFWWLRVTVGLIVRIPFYVLGVAGFNQAAAEASTIGRMYRRVGAAAITVIGLVASLEQLGWINRAKGWLSATGIELP